jgi:hypothetical protein
MNGMHYEIALNVLQYAAGHVLLTGIPCSVSLFNAERISTMLAAIAPLALFL